MPRCRKQPQVKEVYLNEISFLEIANHPNIPKLYGYNDKNRWADNNMTLLPVYSIELEYWPNGELYDYVGSTGKFSEKEARFYFHQLVNILAYLQEMGYSHRDIKSENLLLDENFNLKLWDFGFSTKEDIWSERVGTISYMAPELLVGHEYEWKKIDIFSSGVVLFFLVMGHPPFHKASSKDKYYKRIISDGIDQFWEIHEKKSYSPRSKSFSLFKDLFIQMVHPDPQQRISLEEIVQHDWFNSAAIGEFDLLSSMKLRHKVLSNRIKTNDSSLQTKSLFENFKIRNDNDVKQFPSWSLKKGFQLK